MAITRILARGNGAFPVSMLWRLQAWPATEADAAGIQAACDGCNITPTTLETHSDVTPLALAMFEQHGWSAELVDAGLVPQVQRGWSKVEPLWTQLEQREAAHPHPADEPDLSRAIDQRRGN